MSIKVRINETNKVLKRKRLEKGGPAQIHFTKLCAKYMNNYIPFDTGKLKDMSIEIGVDFVKYDTPYARKQYYSNKGNGTKNKNGLRGKLWNKRMWNDKGKSVVKELADFVGGREG